jgi:hypothetical protein
MEGVYKCKFTNVYSRSAGEPAGYELPVSELDSFVSIGCIGRGDWFLGIPKSLPQPEGALTSFRPEPGFFDWETLIG